MKRTLTLILTLLCTAACGGATDTNRETTSAIGSGASAGNSSSNNGTNNSSDATESSSSDVENTDSSGSGSTETNSATTTTGEASYEINLDDTEALLLQEIAVSSFAITPDVAPDALFLTNGNHATNFWKMDSLGNITPAIGRVNRGESGSERSGTDTSAMVTVNADRIDVSPTGELYVLLSDAIRIGDSLCKWIAVNPYATSTHTNISSCADSDIGFDVNTVVFDPFGNVYYSDTSSEIRMRDVGSGDTVTLFKGDDVDFTIGDFAPAPDGSLFLLGSLSGTIHHLFRYYPEAIFGAAKFESQCLEGTVSGDKQFIVDDDGNIYYNDKSSPNLCLNSNLPRTEYFKITFTANGKAVYTGFSSQIYGYEFARDSQGTIYAVGNVRLANNWNTATVLSDSGHKSVEMSLRESDLFEAKGDYLFATGSDDNGAKVFLRKHLLGAEEEIDLLHGRDMLVQSFDVKENGDVYFGALDYATAKRGLYFYDGDTGRIETLTQIPNDLQTILYLP